MPGISIELESLLSGAEDGVVLDSEDSPAYGELEEISEDRTEATLTYAEDRAKKGKRVLSPHFVAAQVCKTTMGCMIVNESGEGN